MEDIVIPKEMEEYIKVYEKYYKMKSDYEEKKKRRRKILRRHWTFQWEKNYLK
jgi:hypothetical protein